MLNRSWGRAAGVGIVSVGFFYTLNFVSSDLHHGHSAGAAELVLDHCVGVALGAGSGLLAELVSQKRDLWRNISWCRRCSFGLAWWWVVLAVLFCAHHTGRCDSPTRHWR